VGLTNERLQWTGFEGLHAVYQTDQTKMRLQTPVTFGLATALGAVNKFTGEHDGRYFECRNQAHQVKEMHDVFANAAFGCSGEGFFMVFDGECNSGLLRTKDNVYGLDRWNHDKHNYQEGFVVRDASGSTRAALSWYRYNSFVDLGVYVDPSVSAADRESMAVARIVLLAMVDAEEDNWVLCGTIDSLTKRF
jgi:hypothetical protein